MRFCFVFSLLLLAVAAGCQKDTDQSTTAGLGLGVSGVVLEKLDAEPDSYLRLQTEDGEVWAKVPMVDLNAGETANIVQAQEMHNWESPKLQKAFDRLFLGRLDTQGKPGDPETACCDHSTHQSTEQNTPQNMPQEIPREMVQAMEQAGSGKLLGAGVPKLDKAPGANGKTVEEIIASGRSLQGKTISVRGQVVKATSGLKVPNIVGGTWLHIQDGSGDQSKGTHDLTVATDETVAVGEVLVLRGTIRVDDSGMLGGRTILQGAKRVS